MRVSEPSHVADMLSAKVYYNILSCIRAFFLDFIFHAMSLAKLDVPPTTFFYRRRRHIDMSHIQSIARLTGSFLIANTDTRFPVLVGTYESALKLLAHCQ
jgi:hypothetical protein